MVFIPCRSSSATHICFHLLSFTHYLPAFAPMVSELPHDILFHLLAELFQHPIIMSSPIAGLFWMCLLTMASNGFRALASRHFVSIAIIRIINYRGEQPATTEAAPGTEQPTITDHRRTPPPPQQHTTTNNACSCFHPCFQFLHKPSIHQKKFLITYSLKGFSPLDRDWDLFLPVV